jgi:hypothetical protein
MIDRSLPVQPTSRPHGFTLPPQNAVPDPSLPFALTLSRQTPAAWISGENAPAVLDHFPTLAEAMGGAVHHAEEFAPDAAPELLAILDRGDRLVLAGSACDGAVAWCHPVTCAAEARAVVIEASQLRAQAGRAADWSEADLARRLRHRADLLDGRLVDPLWRAFAARALQIAA